MILIETIICIIMSCDSNSGGLGTGRSSLWFCFRPLALKIGRVRPIPQSQHWEIWGLDPSRSFILLGELSLDKGSPHMLVLAMTYCR